MILSNFVPYHEATSDSYLYALKSMSLLQGSWTVTNDNLQKTGDWVYVPNSWKKTIHDTAIPKYPPGFPAIGSVFYLIGNVYGLYYLGPIMGILLLILSERIATNFFGKYVGLLTLIFLATNGIIWVGAKHLLADNFFTIVTLLGIFFLVKFCQCKNSKFLIFSSLFFSFSGFIRLNGMIYFPIEIFVVSAVLIYEGYTKKSIKIGLKNEIEKRFQFNRKNYIKISLSIILPWLIFILFFTSFNNYYFGSPTTTFYNIPDDPSVRPGTGSYFSIFEFKNENFELIKQYSNFVLPYPLYKIETLDIEKIQSERDDPLTSSLVIILSSIMSQNNLGILTFVLMGLSIILAIGKKKKIPIILILSLFISVSIVFWTAGHINFGRDSVFGRYLIPSFPLFSMIFSFLIIDFLNIKINHVSFFRRNLIKIFKIVLFLGLIILVIVAFYNSQPSQIFKEKGLEFSNPIEFANYYPLEKEGLTEKSVILGGDSAWSLDYGFNTFDPYSGSPNQRMSKVYNPELLNQSVIEKLIEFVDDEKNEVFVFKKLTSKHEKTVREALSENYGFVLKEYSTSFCSVELNKNSNDKKSDDICYGK